MGLPQLEYQLEPSSYIYDPERKFYASIKTIEPSMAQRILDEKQDNRSISKATVELYKSFMQRNQWVLNGQPVIFAEGKLIDGQHRLTACVKSNLPLEIFVVELGDLQVFKTLDQGKRRNGADILTIAGYQHSSVINSALGILEKIKHSGSLGYNQLGAGARIPIANHEIEKIASKYPHLQMSCQKTQKWYPDFKLKKGPVAALHYLLREKEQTLVPFAEESQDVELKCDEFFEKLCRGLGLESGDPILYLRNSLLKLLANQVKISPHFIIKGGILTWNKWINGEKVTRLVVGSNPRLPTIKKPLE
jgi:hypothetical protein